MNLRTNVKSFDLFLRIVVLVGVKVSGEFNLILGKCILSRFLKKKTAPNKTLNYLKTNELFLYLFYTALSAFYSTCKL